jgi:hypothetical protein
LRTVSTKANFARFAPSRLAQFTIRRSRHRKRIPASKRSRRSAAARKDWRTQPGFGSCKPSSPPSRCG